MLEIFNVHKIRNYFKIRNYTLSFDPFLTKLIIEK